MKTTTFLLTLLLFVSTGWAQTEKQAELKKQFQEIIELVRNDDAVALSEYIKYPLFRSNIFPVISSKEAFITAYPGIFDASLKEELLEIELEKESKDVMWVAGGIMALEGDFYLEANGLISDIPKSRIEKDLVYGFREALHPSVKNWNQHHLYCSSSEYLIMIYQNLHEEEIEGVMEYVDDYELVLWETPKTIHDEPDIMITGKEATSMPGLPAEEAPAIYGLIHSFANETFDIEIGERFDVDLYKRLDVYIEVTEKGMETVRYEATDIVIPYDPAYDFGKKKSKE